VGSWAIDDVKAKWIPACARMTALRKGFQAASDTNTR
jgi:hypothetical protein